jgi:hypothetical protein
LHFAEYFHETKGVAEVAVVEFEAAVEGVSDSPAIVHG